MQLLNIGWIDKHTECLHANEPEHLDNEIIMYYELLFHVWTLLYTIWQWQLNIFLLPDVKGF